VHGRGPRVAAAARRRTDPLPGARALDFSSAGRFEIWAVLSALSALFFLIAPTALSQQLSDLEPDRPISVEDARPANFRELSGAVDFSYNERNDGLNDYGPGFSLLYGAARGLEVGGALRYVTRPGRNSNRGIASGDLFLHALYEMKNEDAWWPALAIRTDVQLPTGLDSKGTDVHLTALATRSFNAFRLHANFRFTRLGATNPGERFERFEGIGGIDFLVSRRGLTDTLAVADVVVRTNPLIGGPAIYSLEIGARRRIGIQTILFAGAGSDFSGSSVRTPFRVRIGISQTY
jgi:hypothetical protein